MTFDLDYTQELRRTSAAVCRCVVVRLDPLSLNLDTFFRGYLKPASSDIGGALASLASAALYVPTLGVLGSADAQISNQGCSRITMPDCSGCKGGM
jgi:hypothetical protein